MASRVDVIGQNGNSGVHYILDKVNWLKHKNLNWWGFGKYSIERVGVEFICSFGHVEIGRTNCPKNAREICGLHSGLLE